MAHPRRSPASRERASSTRPAAAGPRQQGVRQASSPPQSPAPPAAPAASAPAPYRLPAAWFRGPMGRRERIGMLLAAALAAVLLLLGWGSHLGDEPLRRELEAKMNQHMIGYTVQLGHAHGGPLRLSLTLRDLVIRQQAHPEPPLATIPRLHLTIQWPELLRRHLVGDALFDHPRLHLDVEQLHIERMKRLQLGVRGWQAALESIYPHKLNSMEVNDGSLTYVDEDPASPLEITHWMLSATNIRNLDSPDHVYPSPVNSEGVVFGTGRAAVDGHANFLSDPFPGWHVRYRIWRVPLDRLQQIAARSNWELHSGLLSSHGELEYAPRYKVIDVAAVLLEGVRLDYLHTAATAAAEHRRAAAIAAAARKAESSPVTMRLDRLHLTGGQVGFVNRATDPPYRLYVDRADLEILNMSNRVAGLRGKGAVFRLRGRFMGGGTAAATATFRPGEPTADMGAEIAVEHANLPAFNDFLRAYQKPDVAGGTVSIYSQLTVKNRQLHGYVKTMFDDIKLYDPRKDRGKSWGAKLKERVLGGLAELLENKKSDALATRTELTGTFGAPQANTGQIISSMFRNAFWQAIVPGFDNATRQVPRARPKTAPAPSPG